MKKVYEIMHGDSLVAQIDTHGHCRIYDEKFMPYNLYLEVQDDDIDTLVNNVNNFNYWCASRVLTLDRQYAKEILSSIGASQAVTDRDRANLALSYRCVSLTDIYWVRNKGEEILFKDINLYDNHMDNTFVDISLRGKQITVQNYQLAQDLSTGGCFPKAWVRTESGFQLLKDGGADVVEREVLASRICQCFQCRQVVYTEGYYDGEKVSVSDRHWGNWGLFVDNKNHEPVCLHALMDFNQTFRAYDTPDGARCQTVLPDMMTQREAAIEAVEKTGLNQISEIDAAWFVGREKEYEMLMKRLEILR